jgi:hypothetical protein
LIRTSFFIVEVYEEVSFMSIR